MVQARESVTVQFPIDEVFAFLADGLNNPKWRPGVVCIALKSGSGVGTVYTQTMAGPGGRTIQGDYRITRSDAPTQLDFEVVAGPARPTGSFRLRSLSPTSTEVELSIKLILTGMLTLVPAMVARQVTTEVDAIRRLPRAMAG
ncbi:SRPBCC family protein [Cryobacterium psychrophilum]|uniref:Uncharacterized protein n=1 Tax=Cryobacterium psychrophilum TaxID=41988 RepID=A0A4Y8KRY0_9MICO|nr:SRPBCC family protein [Cryobacterium psychrophilum]TDW28720.1 polyketide cyclase/dehydrase/lipid transport protein [Cryobacterium psychrophilum]TFD82380.1 hypothetical protein E3T53_00440 [Cryobacterium psychrophilum]